MLVSILMSASSLAISDAQAMNPTRRLPDSVLESGDRGIGGKL
jgi:hypothetical protein